MTGVGIVTATAIGLAVLMWIGNLIWQDRLYVGYGVILVCGTIAGIVALGAPPLRRATTAASQALLPVPSLTLIPIVIFTFLMLYVFTQITFLSNLVSRLTQELAIRDAQQQHGVESGTARLHSSAAGTDSSRV